MAEFLLIPTRGPKKRESTVIFFCFFLRYCHGGCLRLSLNVNISYLSKEHNGFESPLNGFGSLRIAFSLSKSIFTWSYRNISLYLFPSLYLLQFPCYPSLSQKCYHISVTLLPWLRQFYHRCYYYDYWCYNWCHYYLYYHAYCYIITVSLSFYYNCYDYYCGYCCNIVYCTYHRHHRLYHCYYHRKKIVNIDIYWYLVHCTTTIDIKHEEENQGPLTLASASGRDKS